MTDRKLVPDDPELRAEGWMVVDDRGFALMWAHPPSRRCVHVQPKGLGGYLVGTAAHDENGYPVEGTERFLDAATFAHAVRQARFIRRSILDEPKDVAIAEQLELVEAPVHAFDELGRLIREAEEALLSACCGLPPGVCRECGGKGSRKYIDHCEYSEIDYREQCRRCGGSGFEYVHGGPYETDT